MASGNALETGRATDLAHQLIEAVRRACIGAAIDGYERASISGLCHEGAWEAAVSAIRTAALDALAEQAVHDDRERVAEAPVATENLLDATLRLAKRFASPGPPAAGSAAAVTGAIAAGLLEWTAALSALRGTEGFHKRARSIASRAAALQHSLSTAAQTDAERVERWMEALREVRGAAPKEPGATPAALAAATDSVLDVAARCGQVTTLAAEVARHGHAAVQRDAAAALQLTASAADCALALAEENLRSAVESDWTRSTKRRIWRTRLLLHRGRQALQPRHDG
jgi:formiminotetrahydrofolate cyclodeaminase